MKRMGVTSLAIVALLLLFLSARTFGSEPFKPHLLGDARASIPKGVTYLFDTRAIVGHGNRVVAYMARRGKLTVRDTARHSSTVFDVPGDCRPADATDREVLLNCGRRERHRGLIVDATTGARSHAPQSGRLSVQRIGRHWLYGHRCRNEGDEFICQPLYVNRATQRIVPGEDGYMQLDHRNLRPRAAPPRSVSSDPDDAFAYAPPYAVVYDYVDGDDTMSLRAVGTPPQRLTPFATPYIGGAGLEMTPRAVAWIPNSYRDEEQAYVYDITAGTKYHWTAPGRVLPSITQHEVLFSVGAYDSHRRRIYAISTKAFSR